MSNHSTTIALLIILALTAVSVVSPHHSISEQTAYRHNHSYAFVSIHSEAKEAHSVPDDDLVHTPSSNKEAVPDVTNDVVVEEEHDTGDTGQPEIIAWLSVGYSSRNARDRLIGWNLSKQGWPGLIHKQFWPQIRWGSRRIMLHNPFGARPDDDAMPFDQYLEAKEEGLAWLTDGFVSAWKKVVEGKYTDGEQVEVIGYIGSVTQDPDMVALLEANDLEAWHKRAWASVSPLVEAGMSVAFDAGSLVEKDHPAYQFMLDLQKSGTRVYIETYPPKDKPHLYQFDVIMLSRFNQVVIDHQSKYPTRDELKNRVSRLVNAHAHDPEDPNWQVNKTIEALSNGDNVIININGLIKAGWTKQRLMNRVEAHREAKQD